MTQYLILDLTIIFLADMSSSVHIDNKGNNTLILGEGPTLGLDDTILTADTKYPCKFFTIRKTIIGLLTSMLNASNPIKYVLFSDQTQPTLINFHPNKYSQKFHYYPFAFKLDRCVGSCNTLND